MIDMDIQGYTEASRIWQIEDESYPLSSETPKANGRRFVTKSSRVSGIPARRMLIKKRILSFGWRMPSALN